MITPQVPQLSLRDERHGGAQSRREFCDAVFAGLRDYGFLTLGGHGSPTSLLDQVYELTESLFVQAPAAKLQHRGGLRGYTPFGTEHARNHHYPDLKQFWQIGHEVPTGWNCWPPTCCHHGWRLPRTEAARNRP